jgi:hypothetical protein
MSNNNQNSKSSHKPAYIAYQVRETSGESSFWTRIGVAWKHHSGDGVNIQLDAFPVDGCITLRLATEVKN